MLKKFLLFLILFSLSVTTAFADKIPTSSKSIRHYGIGVLKIENDFSVYSKPNKTSKILKHFSLTDSGKKTAIVQDTRKTVNPFIVSIPGQKDYFATIYEYPHDDWVQIYYNQNGKEIGWVKIQHKSDFMTWKEFFYKYGKKNGLKLMKDTPANTFKLYAQDSEDAKIVDEFSYPEYIACRMIRGNWMLITVVDSGNIYKTGWFKWRTNEGKLRVFPRMKN